MDRKSRSHIYFRRQILNMVILITSAKNDDHMRMGPYPATIPNGELRYPLRFITRFKSKTFLETSYSQYFPSDFMRVGTFRSFNVDEFS